MDEPQEKHPDESKQRPLTIDEIADYLQRSRGTIYNYMDDGMPYTQVGGGPRFEPEKVMEWFRERQAKKKAERKKRHQVRQEHRDGD